MLKNEIKNSKNTLFSKFAFKDLYDKANKCLSNKESPFIRSMKKRQILRNKF